MQNASTRSGVNAAASSPSPANHPLTCAISRSCPATDKAVYPRRRNSRLNPDAYGANGPTTLTTDCFGIADRLLSRAPCPAKEHPSAACDYAETTQAEGPARPTSAGQPGTPADPLRIIPGSA